MRSSLDLFSLEGQVSLVTGSARGLGQGMARALAQAGSDLALVDILSETLSETAAALAEETGRRVLALPADLSRIEEPAELVRRTVAGLGRLDVLVNNAATTVRKPFLEIAPDEFDRVVAVNARAAYFLSQHAARRMIAQGRGGKIINMASLSCEIGIRNLTAYGVSKGGVYALTKGLAVELAPHRIRVNAIAPGFFATDLTAPVWSDDRRRPNIEARIPLGRMGTPDDIAGTIVYLASAASDYLTGRVIYLDGGWMAS
ncbi:MAG: glucose 1-dehydrogenase [Thermodesulfobacteriota bacterium]